ncbi:MAG TPA: hypothetical protein DCS93_44270 [Microscillaceae bacterium]|nr:hypothetical protein [Microscillaceae bacterium]
MKLLIIGAGRMGVRHAQGALNVSAISAITLVDINQSALDNATQALNSDQVTLEFLLIDQFEAQPGEFDVAIIASTASNRKTTLDLVQKTNCKHILVEKPLGQSQEEVEDLIDYTASFSAHVAVNLNMRLYDNFIELKNTLNTHPQYIGDKVISLNTGTLGIGANGIHYLDLCYFLLDANKAELVAGEIESSLIPSGRGSQFGDFGGWCTIKFYQDEQYKGRAHLSLTSQSSAFGGWQITAPHARIYYNEVEQTIVHQVRKEGSEMPIYRYAADYLSPKTKDFVSPFLGDLTAKWLEGLAQNQELLPSMKDSLGAHELMFQWLNLSPTHTQTFPIT